jgi:hypothetical protein
VEGEEEAEQGGADGKGEGTMTGGGGAWPLEDYTHVRGDFEIERIFSEKVEALWVEEEGGGQHMEVISGDAEKGR